VSDLVAWTEEDQNRAALDPWTAVHGAAGLAVGLLGLPLWASLLAAVGYELAENRFERTEAGQRFFNTSGPESLPNQLVDVLVFAAGAWAGRKYKAGS
jgi:hypothetical protein